MNLEGRIHIPKDYTVDGVNRDEIFLTKECAIMPMRILHQIPAYTHTNPTGVFPGKMWVRRMQFMQAVRVVANQRKENPVAPEIQHGYLFCWYGRESPVTRECTLHSAPVQVLDWKKLMGLN